MARTLALPCSRCGRKFGGQQTLDRHSHIAGDVYRCRPDAELLSRGFYKDSYGVWHRGSDPNQTSLLGLSETVRSTSPARAAADVAVAQVERGASLTWLRLALGAVRGLAAARQEITAEDVWGVLERAEVKAPREPRAMGAVMRQAQQRGWITPTTRYRIGARVQSHSRPERIWESRLFQAVPA